ncbi:P-loop containing nucleoside triphosphate hydrolase protein [Entophlyctis helioformis]|nr:P-loop containing nucleoside triphosphate hydrolase protein [Entophlyctis helioformis]
MDALDALAGGSYARRARKLVQLVNTLRSSGAHLDLDLATIAICGNQSVGKSSVVEAICGIKLPVSDSTCTRSVTELRLIDGPSDAALAAATPSRRPPSAMAAAAPPSLPLQPPAPAHAPSHAPAHAAPWSCAIKLRFEFDSTGAPLKSVREVPFGPVLRSKDSVPLAVRRAQKALLNPSTDAALFVNHHFGDSSQAAIDSDVRSNELRFTRNVVCLDIEGAGINLTLVDLPGIIRTVDKREDSIYIDMIQDLVRSYISHERTIILSVISCKDEIENQAIVSMARDVDPTGSRTIGVLTKPDTIESGTTDRWAAIASGHEYPLKLGYFMVKCLSKSEIASGKTLDDARMLEDSFFNSTEPWAALRRKSDRFGVPALRTELSRLLASLIDASLPHMKALTEEAIEAVMLELSQIPAAPSENARIELLQMIRHYCALVTYNINAQHDFKLFYQKVRGHFEVWRDRVGSTRPTFDLERKGFNATAVASVSPSSTQYSAPETKTSRSASTSSSASAMASASAASPSSSWASRGSASLSNGPIELAKLDARKHLTLGDLRRIIDAQKGRELQGYSPYSAFTFLVSACQEDWNKHAAACMAAVSQELSILLTELTEKVFGRFANLQGKLKLFTQMFQTELHRVTMEQINHLVVMERRYPFTLNSGVFSERKTRFMHALMGQMDQLSLASTSLQMSSVGGSSGGSNGGGSQGKATSESLQRAVAALAEAGITGLTPQLLSTKLRAPGTSNVSGMDPAMMDLMASTLSYMDIAIARLGDTVPMAIEYHFLSQFGELLEKELVAQLGVLDGQQDMLGEMLREDWGIAERRSAAESRRVRLEAVWRSLHDYGL